MRNVWKAWAIAAGIACTTIAASAQQTALKASVPFEFTINGGADLAAGDYIVTRDRNVWLVRNEETGHAVIIRSVPYEGKDSEMPSLTFNCVREHCQLRSIHAGRRALGAEIPAHRLNKSDAAELAVVTIPLAPARGA